MKGPLAIIGIGCLFPGSRDLASYWARITGRFDAIRDVPPTHWRPADYLHPDPQAPDRVYTARGGFLDPAPFNPADFGIAPNDLEATDTAQLLALVVARQALEDAGYETGVRGPGSGVGKEQGPSSLTPGPWPLTPSLRPLPDRKRVSVILGVTGTLELVIPLGARLGHPIWRRALKEAGVADEVADDVVRRIADSYVGWQENSFPGLLGNVVAGRVANRFDLGGTNCVVDAACASSLSALHLAALELESGRSDLVLTGGVDAFNDVFMYMCFSKTPALSPTGNARPFDRSADGTILGEGIGMVVLKRLADARRDGDRVYAVLRGIGTSSDGRGNAVYAPRAGGQVEALRGAYRAAGFGPDTVELVEAHGTGTHVGDATEVAALTEVYQSAGRPGTWCALGSVKSQIGHTKAAAGVAGLIKAAAALHHKVLPPTIKVERPLDALEPGHSPFYVNAEKRPWAPSPDHPRRAAVSAFGFGGSNFHCVLEEAQPDKPGIDWDGAVQVVALAADTPARLGEQLSAWPAELPWDELRARAAASRSAWDGSAACRLLLVVQRGRADLARLLAAARDLLARHTEQTFARSPEGVFYGRGSGAGKLAVLFPGQGAQYVGMLRDLACHFPPAHDALAGADRASREAHAGSNDRRLSDRVYPPAAFTPEARAADEAALRATDVAQPALGAVGLGGWRVLEHFGVRADAFAGHSYGELVALCAAGRLDPADLHALSLLRGRLMACGGNEPPGSTKDPGAMLAVQAPPEAVVDVLRAEGIDLVLANKNAPRQTVLSGPTPMVERAAAAFAARQLRTQRLAVAAAFHSPLVAAAERPFRAALERVPFRPARAPVFANTTAGPYPDDPGPARDLLAGQLARPVEFVAEVEQLHAFGCRTFLEVGPGSRLTGLVDAILHDRGHTALALDSSGGQRPGLFDLACCLAGLAALGHDIRLAAWDDVPPPPAPAAEGARKPALIVPICGANYVKPRPSGVSATSPPRVPAPETRPATNGKPTPPMNGSHLPEPTPPLPVAPRRSTPPPAPAADTGLAQALQVTRESLAALQKMQEQASNLHRQFLEGQEAAQRTVHLLVEQQQRLLQAALGLPPEPRPSGRGEVVGRAESSRPTTENGQAEGPLSDASPKRFDTPAPVEPPGPAPPQTTPTPTPAADAHAPIAGVLLEVIAEKTGYPTEMLDLDMALDADLGIDSIKRVEILSALQERLPAAPAIKPEHLGSLHNLRQVVAFLASRGQEPPEVASGACQRPGPATTPLERNILHAVPIPDAPRESIRLAPGSEIWIAAADVSLARALDQRLRAQGFRPRLVPCAGLRDLDHPAALGGLVLLAPPEPINDAFLRDALLALRHAAPALRQAGRQGGAVLLTVSRLDGAFGLGELDPEREPLDGGLAGLAKTARHEWPEVRCKALDLAPGADPAAIVEEMFLAGPIEVGLSPAGRRTLERVARPLAAGGTPPFQPGDVVVLSGGARGVTAEAAVALARAFRPTLVLLGRSPAPEPEPDWLLPLTTETEIKRALGARANGDATPRLIGEQYRLVAARREVRRTLERIEAAGARALYRTVDVRDAAAVAALLTPLRAELGPVRGLVHGAGVLADALIEDKTGEQFDRVYGTKVLGLRALLAALPPEELRALVLFSSSTARFGRKGQADYAVANEVLNKLARQQARRLPACRVVAVNWGPWDGGMVTPALKKVFEQEGIGLIPPDAGADYLVQELRSVPDQAVEVTVGLRIADCGLRIPEPEQTGTPIGAAQSAIRNPQSAMELPLAFERVLDRAAHPVLDAHVFDGRPVLPAVLILEWLAHAALHHNPGLLFHGCDDLRILHGVTLDGPGAPVLRVGAGKATPRDGLFAVPTELRSRRPDGREVLHARAEILLAGGLPPAPPAHPLPDLLPYPRTPEEIYPALLFHGAPLQGLEQVEGCGDQGIVASVRGEPAPAAWVRQPLRQSWITAPLALDCGFQLMVLWTLEQQGAPSLPCSVGRYRQYRRAFPAAGARVAVRVTRATALHALADIDYLDADGRLLARMEGYECAIDPALRRAFQRNQPVTA